jgi:hypothetical protein
MRLAGTVILLGALVACNVSCAGGERRAAPEPVIHKDATITPEREDSEQIERTERKHTNPWKH